MIIVGLTGSIGMGKTTTAAAFRRLGIPVHDADRVVHGLTAPGGKILPTIEKAFPGSVIAGRLDRAGLGKRVFDDPKALARLEAILHPQVRAAKLDFLDNAARRREPIVVLDIPLLFEKGSDKWCDVVVVASAPPSIQARRVLARPGMTPAKLAAVLGRQVSDRIKRRRADFIVDTGLGLSYAFRQVRRIVVQFRNRRGTSWPFRGRMGRLRADARTVRGT